MKLESPKGGFTVTVPDRPEDTLGDIQSAFDFVPFEPKSKDELGKGGARFDAGKSRVDLIPADLLLQLGEIYQMGAVKYDASNWRKGMKWSKVYGPLLRHLYKAWCRTGDDLYDEESRKHHIMHALWNVVGLAYYMLRPEYKKFDDRQDVVNIVDMPEEERQALYV